MRGISRAEATGGIEPLWHRNRRCPMTHAKRLWSIWQALLSAFAWAFTRPSFRRFADGDDRPPWDGNRDAISLPRSLRSGLLSILIASWFPSSKDISKR